VQKFLRLSPQLNAVPLLALNSLREVIDKINSMRLIRKRLLRSEMKRVFLAKFQENIKFSHLSWEAKPVETSSWFRDVTYVSVMTLTEELFLWQIIALFTNRTLPVL